MQFNRKIKSLNLFKKFNSTKVIKNFMLNQFNNQVAPQSTIKIYHFSKFHCYSEVFCDKKNNLIENKKVKNVPHFGEEKMENKQKEEKETFVKNSSSEGFNVDEELMRYDYEEYEEFVEKEENEEKKDNQEKIIYKRGATGVYDLDELLSLLEEFNLSEVNVLEIPNEFNYCNFMVFATGKTPKHLKAAAEKIKKDYKVKRENKDPKSVKVEGLLSENWLALDLGNIVVHLFMADVRSKYKLERLWSGEENEDQEENKVDKKAEEELNCFNFEKEFEKIKKFKEEFYHQFNKNNNIDSENNDKKDYKNINNNVNS